MSLVTAENLPVAIQPTFKEDQTDIFAVLPRQINYKLYQGRGRPRLTDYINWYQIPLSFV